MITAATHPALRTTPPPVLPDPHLQLGDGGAVQRDLHVRLGVSQHDADTAGHLKGTGEGGSAARRQAE